MKQNQPLTFALYFGNRGFFPESLVAGARHEMKQAVERNGHRALLLDEAETRFGAVESTEEGRKYARFLRENKGKYNGVILCLPNFGDETGAVAALEDCGVPILIQAYPDELDKMGFSRRRTRFAANSRSWMCFTNMACATRPSNRMPSIRRPRDLMNR